MERLSRWKSWRCVQRRLGRGIGYYVKRTKLCISIIILMHSCTLKWWQVNQFNMSAKTIILKLQSTFLRMTCFRKFHCKCYFMLHWVSTTSTARILPPADNQQDPGPFQWFYDSTGKSLKSHWIHNRTFRRRVFQTIDCTGTVKK